MSTIAQQTLRFDDSASDFIIDERQKEIEKVKSQTVQLNKLMKQTSSMIHGQAEDIDSIAINIRNARQNVQDGNQSLKKAEENQQSCTLI
jgi:t-SNARE complex subunit (syntaxin)